MFLALAQSKAEPLHAVAISHRAPCFPLSFGDSTSPAILLVLGKGFPALKSAGKAWKRDTKKPSQPSGQRKQPQNFDIRKWEDFYVSHYWCDPISKARRHKSKHKKVKTFIRVKHQPTLRFPVKTGQLVFITGSFILFFPRKPFSTRQRDRQLQGNVASQVALPPAAAPGSTRPTSFWPIHPDLLFLPGLPLLGTDFPFFVPARFTLCRAGRSVPEPPSLGALCQAKPRSPNPSVTQRAPTCSQTMTMVDPEPRSSTPQKQPCSSSRAPPARFERLQMEEKHHENPLNHGFLGREAQG